MAEERERGAVGGVDVLQRDADQPLARRGADERRDRVEHPQPGLLAARVGGLARGRQLRRPPVAGQPAHVVEHPGGQPAGRGGERAQRGAPRAVGARLLVGAAADHGRAARGGLRDRLVDQAGLPDPGLAGDRDHAGAPRLGRAERAAQLLQLRLAPDDRLAVGGERGDGDARGAAQPVERVAHGGRVRRAVLRALGQQRQHERVEPGRDPRRVARGRLGLRVAVLREQRDGVGAGERRPPAQQLPQRRAERIEVGLRQRRGAGALLGRLVVRRPRGGGGAAGRIAGDHRDAEVAEARAAVGAEPDVVRLDVAVDDPVGVGVGERVGERPAGAQDLRGLEPPVRHGGEPLGERAAGHVARDDVQHAPVDDRVEHGDDVGVVAEPRHEARLAPHPLARLGADLAGAGARDRHRPLERRVVGEPDLLRAAAPEHPLEDVAAVDHRRGRRGLRGGRPGERRAGGTDRPRGQRAAAARAAGGGIVGQRRRRPSLGVGRFHPRADGPGGATPGESFSTRSSPTGSHQETP